MTKHSGWKRVLGLIIPYIFILVIFEGIGLTLAGVDIAEVAKLNELNTLPELTTFQDLIIMIFNCVGTLFCLWIFMKFVDKSEFINLGFHHHGRLKEFLIGNLLGFTIMIIAFVILILINQTQFSVIVFLPLELISSFALFTLVAIAEETLCRGYILRNLMLSFNKYTALVISALLFSVMHGANPNISLIGFIGLFLAGITLGISYIYTQNLWFPIGLHLSWNLAQSLVGFNVSGQDFYSLIEISVIENNVLNGGEFGFEGSILSLLADLILISLIAWYYEKTHAEQTLNN